MAALKSVTSEVATPPSAGSRQFSHVTCRSLEPWTSFVTLNCIAKLCMPASKTVWAALLDGRKYKLMHLGAVAKQLREIHSTQAQHQAAMQQDVNALRQGQAMLLKEVAELKSKVKVRVESQLQLPQHAAPAAKRSRQLLPEVMSQAMFTSLTTATAEPMDALFFSQA